MLYNIWHWFVFLRLVSLYYYSLYTINTKRNLKLFLSLLDNVERGCYHENMIFSDSSWICPKSKMYMILVTFFSTLFANIIIYKIWCCYKNKKPVINATNYQPPRSGQRHQSVQANRHIVNLPRIIDLPPPYTSLNHDEINSQRQLTRPVQIA